MFVWFWFALFPLLGSPFFRFHGVCASNVHFVVFVFVREGCYFRCFFCYLLFVAFVDVVVFTLLFVLIF